MNQLPRLIGVIQLPALPGAPGSAHLEPSEALRIAGLQAVKEAQLLARAGIQGVLIQNRGDVPYFKTTVPAETVASLSIIAAAVKESIRIPVGIEVLGHDPMAALAIATVSGCDFIRAQFLNESPFALNEERKNCSAHLLRERQRLGSSVAVLGDLPHPQPTPWPPENPSKSLDEFAQAHLFDAIILPHAEPQKINPSQGTPVYIALDRDFSPQEFEEILKTGVGVILGSALRKSQTPGGPLDPKRIQALIKIFKSALRVRKKLAPHPTKKAGTKNRSRKKKSHS